MMMSVQEAMELAVRKHRAGQIAEAEEIYRQVLARQPDLPDAVNLLGVALQQRGQLDEAAQWIGRAIRLAPRSADFHFNMGILLLHQKKESQAEIEFRSAVALRPSSDEYHFQLGATLQSQWKLPQAIAEFQAALNLTADHAGALAALRRARADMAQWPEAIDLARRCLALDPRDAKAHLDLGILLLRMGDFAGGWPEYEWRWRVKDLEVGPLTSAQPAWDGQELAGRRIVLHCEQGFGDAIQMIRYAPMVRQRGGKTLVFCQRNLARLFGSAEGIDEIITWANMPPACEVHCPLLSLPKAFNTDLAGIPNRVPYLWADANLSRQWRERIGGEARLKVGIVWTGYTGHLRNQQRSISLDRLEKLFSPARMRLFSLQKGRAAEQVRSAETDITDWTQELKDFADTAALIDNLDLVVTIDSSVAHLAGALGKKTWVLLPLSSDWRWLLDRTDSPWYPTMRLFRQRTMDDWEPPLREVAGALQEL
jgi:Flp pilus assembly protein TadD